MSTEYEAADHGLWAAVVHGRTRDQDMWWRALPQGVAKDGPEAGIVVAAVGGGRFAEQSGGLPAPRFVLARLPGGTLLGVACQFRLISDDMHANESRALFGFVGWLCADPHVPVPSLAEVERGWAIWAREEYERRMRPVWDETANRVRQIDQTGAEPPPWVTALAAPYAGPPVGPEMRAQYDTPPPDRVRVYSSADEGRIWQGVTLYGRSAAVVTGWGTIQDAIRPGITHVGVDSLPAGFEEIHPVPQAGQAMRPPQGYPAGTGYPTQSGTAGRSSDGQYVAQAARAGQEWYGAGPSQQSGQRDFREESANSGGWGRGLINKAAGAWQGAVEYFTDDDQLQGGTGRQPMPPLPPPGKAQWAFSPDRLAFRTRQAGWVYHAELGRPAIDCWLEERPTERFRFQTDGRQWTVERVPKQGGADAPDVTRSPGGQQEADSKPRPSNQPGPHPGPTIEPHIPKDIGSSLNAVFGDDWGKDEAQERRSPGYPGTPTQSSAGDPSGAD